VAAARSGGEDYVLLFALAPGKRPPPRFGCVAIGVATARPGRLFWKYDDALRPLQPEGWDHFAARKPLGPSGRE